MTSHPNGSGDRRGPNASGPPTDLQSLLSEGPTDFQSLTSAPTREQKAPAPGPATDFHSLTGGRPLFQRNLYQHRTPTDTLIDFTTPLMILVMVWAVVFFLLDVRYVYTEVHDQNLRVFGVCFVLGVVALNRLIAREGKEESFMYVFGLGGVVILYTIATTTAYDVGSVSKTFMNDPGFALAFNLSVVIFLWWLVNRLTHECCIDENQTAGDVGILTGTARKMLKATETKTPKVVSTATLDAIDPLEWKPAEKKTQKPIDAVDRLQKRHPGISIFYFSIPVMIVFALGLRVILHGGRPMVLAGHFYVGCYTVAALTLLMLTSLAGLREYFRARRIHLPGALGPFWLGLGSVMVVMVAFGAAAMPMPELPPIAYVSEHEIDYWTKDSTFQLQSVVTPAVEQLEQARFMQRIGTVVLAVLGLFVAYAAIRGIGMAVATIARNRLRFPQWVVRFFDALDRILMRLARLPKFPERRRHRRVDKATAQSVRFSNPMKAMPHGAHADPRKLIETSYDALCALAYDLGVPREKSQTPFEFLEHFPRELNSLKEEAAELTRLYVQSAYSPVQLDPRVEDRLRKFWLAYERTRNRVLR